VTITGFLILGSGFLLITLVIVPEITHRLRTGTFYSRTPIYYGWIVLFTGALGAFAAVSIAGAVLGGLQSLISADTGWSRASIGFTASAGVWTSGVVAPLLGPYADRYGPRWLMPLGTIFLGLCMVALGGVNAIWQFFIIAVLARAIGQPLFIGLLPRTMAVNFFQRRRNLALAFTSLVRPVASAINIQVILAIAASKGWRAGFRYLGFITLVLTIPIFLVVRRRPEDIGLLPDGDKPDGASRYSTAPATADSSLRPTQPSAQLSADWTARQAMSTTAFWLVSFSTFLVLAAASGIGFNMVPYFIETGGLSVTQAATVLSASTLLSLCNLGWGFLADRFSPRTITLCGYLTTLGTLFYMFTVNNLASAWIFGVTWGVFSSASDALVSMIMAQYYGRSSYGTIMGALRPFEAAGLGVGQSLGALIYDFTGSYSLLILSSSAILFTTSALMLLTRRPVRPGSATAR
jgi:sugar phosphate permease